MRKTKTQKGITLVALIITIVVLLILAVVAINAIQDEDLIGKANSAVTSYNQSVTNEGTQLGNYSNAIGEHMQNITANSGSNGPRKIKFYIQHMLGEDGDSVTIEYEAVEGQNFVDWYNETGHVYEFLTIGGDDEVGYYINCNAMTFGSASETIIANYTYLVDCWGDH